MIRVRGTAAYRLQVTRTTTVAALCAWLGIDRERLLQANPDLVSDELPEGRELVVPADWMAAAEPLQDEGGGRAELPEPEARASAPEGTAEPGEDATLMEHGPTQEADPVPGPGADGGAPASHVHGSGMDAHSAVAAQTDGGPAAEEEAAGAARTSPPAADSHQARPAATVPDAPPVPASLQPLRWRPFPKPALK